ncbi:MAG: MFS transporter [Caulobacterales bacterium]
MSENPFLALDEQPMRAFHWKTMLTTGLGVFCDGYDISAITLVLGLTLQSYHAGKVASVAGGELASAAVIGSMFGALIFGALGQKGRKRFYGFDVLVLGVAALAQAFMPNLLSLIVCRFILGIGVGGDYVLSPMIMGEHANRKDRGKALGLGFGAMWPLGALAAAVFELLLTSFHVRSDLVWRLVLAGGTVPALGVMYFRRTMPETARFLARVAQDKAQAEAVTQEVSGVTVTAASAVDRRPLRQVFAAHARHIFAAALLWLVYDLMVYAGVLFGPGLIAESLGIQPAVYSIMTELIFILPATVLMAWFLIDRAGRKPMQVWGFFASAGVLALFAVLRSTPGSSALVAYLVVGLFNVTQQGPGLVSGSGIYGVELSPTSIRSLAQGITVIGGRLGASISTFAFPVMVGTVGLVGSMWTLAGIAVVGGILSQLLVPETGSRSLEDINAESFAAIS